MLSMMTFDTISDFCDFLYRRNPDHRNINLVFTRLPYVQNGPIAVTLDYSDIDEEESLEIHKYFHDNHINHICEQNPMNGKHIVYCIDAFSEEEWKKNQLYIYDYCPKFNPLRELAAQFGGGDIFDDINDDKFVEDIVTKCLDFLDKRSDFDEYQMYFEDLYIDLMNKLSKEKNEQSKWVWSVMVYFIDDILMEIDSTDMLDTLGEFGIAIAMK